MIIHIFLLLLLTALANTSLASSLDKQDNKEDKQEKIINPLDILAQKETEDCTMKEEDEEVHEFEEGELRYGSDDSDETQSDDDQSEDYGQLDLKSLSCHFPDCDYVAANLAKLKRHFKKHTCEKPYECEYPGCVYAANEKSALKSHIAQNHTNYKPFKCNQCDYAAVTETRLKIHIRKHTGEKPYKCNWAGCNYASAQQSNLITHTRRHTGEKPFMCGIEGCDFAAADKATVIKHMNSSKHKQPTNKSSKIIKLLIKNGQAQQDASGDTIMPDASETDVKPDLNPFKKRPLEGQELQSEQPAKKQKKEITKNFKCSYSGCTYAASSASKLKNHFKKHTGEKPYKCDYKECDYAASEKYSLQAHKAHNHTGEKPYKCDYCQYATVNESRLKIHIRTHTGEKPHKCDYPGCSYASAQSNGLTVHKRVHTGEKPFKCTHADCDYAAADQGSLAKHLKSIKHQSVKASSAIVQLLIKKGQDQDKKDTK